jgi:Fe/S biogenesis protein NfuA
MNSPRLTTVSSRSEVSASPSGEGDRTSTISLVQAPASVRPPRAESGCCGHTAAQLETGIALSSGPMLAITENALRYVRERKEKLGLPVKGMRVKALPRSPLRAEFALSFVPAEEPESPTDLIQSAEGLDIHIGLESTPYLEGATIDYVFKLIGSELKVLAPLRKLDTPDGRIAAKIQEVLDEEVNPSLATHGGGAVMIDFKDGVVFLELTGGCQGCSQAGATMKDGIETSIRERIPEVQEVRDITKHANGMNPYFQ